MVWPDRSQMTTQHGKEKMQFSCQINKARRQTNIHNINEFLLFHSNKGYVNAPHVMIHTDCLSCSFLWFRYVTHWSLMYTAVVSFHVKVKKGGNAAQYIGFTTDGWVCRAWCYPMGRGHGTIYIIILTVTEGCEHQAMWNLYIMQHPPSSSMTLKIASAMYTITE